MGDVERVQQHPALDRIIIGQVFAVLPVSCQRPRAQQKLLRQLLLGGDQLFQPVDSLQRLLKLELGIERNNLLFQIANFKILRAQRYEKTVLVQPQALQ